MIDKIKGAAQAAKGFILWIATPITILLGIIWFYVTKSSGLEQQLNNERATKALDQVKDKLAEAGKEADAKEQDAGKLHADFATAMEQYRKNGGDLPPGA